uniref:Uncharacterized protein n=1 Tax=Trichuris muris TaxID=70415 RepID=A0A5S6QYN2_TRIMR
MKVSLDRITQLSDFQATVSLFFWLQSGVQISSFKRLFNIGLGQSYLTILGIAATVRSDVAIATGSPLWSLLKSGGNVHSLFPFESPDVLD